MAIDLDERTTGREAGEIFAFPLAARIGDVDRCARELDSVHGSAAVQYWKGECHKLAQQLSAVGLSEDKIRQEILMFQSEVQAAIARCYDARALGRNRSDGGV